MSVLLVWAGLTRSPALRVPAVVAYVVAGVLALAAWRLLQLLRRAPGRGDGWAMLMLAGFAAIGTWIAAGPGPRVCTVGQGGRAGAEVAGLACRVPFGVGAVLVILLALYASQRWLAARRGAGG